MAQKELPLKNLLELAKLFLKIGTIGFGGPAAHIAMMEDEVVNRRGWYSKKEFLDLIAVTNLIPGPNSTEMAIHIGYKQGGILGLLIAGVCFILPAFIIVLLLSWLYVKHGILPEATAMLNGIKPVVLAIIIQALIRLGKSVFSTKILVLVSAICLILKLAGLNELTVLAIGAFSCLTLSKLTFSISNKTCSLIPIGSFIKNPLILAITTLPTLASASLWQMFFIFMKIGSVIFGSGYVLLAFIKADLVDSLGWITDAQLLDAVIIGQITPGPVFTTATFIGYLLKGTEGAIVATLGIFIPAFLFVALTAPYIRRLRESKILGCILDGLNSASLALMAGVTFELSQHTLIDLFTMTEFVMALVLLYFFNLSSTWLILLGAVAGGLLLN